MAWYTAGGLLVVASGGGALATPSGLPPATFLIRNDGVAQSGIPAYTSLDSAFSAGHGVAGDIGEYQPNTVNGSATFGAGSSGLVMNFTNKNYSASQPLTIRTQAGGSYRWAANNNTTIGGGNCSYITLDLSAAASAKIGDADVNWNWSTSTATGLPTTSPTNNLCFYSGANHIRLIGGGFNWASAPGTAKTICYGAQNYSSNIVDGSCSYVYFHGMEFYLGGNNHWINPNQGNANWNSGNLLVFDPVNGLLEYCRIAVGGHDALVMEGTGIIANNNIANWWGSGATIVNGVTGYNSCRCSSIAAGDRNGSFGVVNGANGGNGANLVPGAPFGPLFVIGNVWNDAGGAGGVTVDQPMTKMDTFQAVVMGNYFLDNTWGQAFQNQYFGCSASGTTRVDANQRFAHNTLVKTRGIARFTDSLFGGDTVGPVDEEARRIEDNVIYDLDADVEGGGFVGAIVNDLTTNSSTDQSSEYGSGSGTWPDYWKGGTFRHNLVVMASGFTTGADNVVLAGGANSGTVTFDTSPGAWSASGIDGGQYCSANTRCTTGSGASRVDFTNLGTAPNRQYSGLTLAGTSTLGIGDSNPRTTATASSSGTVITVADPRWFPADAVVVDAFIPEFQNYYPYISLPNGIRKVLSVNYATKQLTVNAAIVVTINDPIFFAGVDGAQAWNNRGAAQ